MIPRTNAGWRPVWVDLVNSGFETLGAGLVWVNVVRIRRDKAVLGSDWRVSAAWLIPSIWYAIYYAKLGHWLSLAAHLVMLLGSLTWVAHAVVYDRRSSDSGARAGGGAGV